MIAYADSSALVKLVVTEPESCALVAALARYSTVATSELAVVEVTRSAMRAAGDAGVVRAGEVLDCLQLLRLDRHVLLRASRLGPAHLRSLDAVHVASALEFDTPLELVGYDDRLLAAAAVAGLPTLSPA